MTEPVFNPEPMTFAEAERALKAIEARLENPQGTALEKLDLIAQRDRLRVLVTELKEPMLRADLAAADAELESLTTPHHQATQAREAAQKRFNAAQRTFSEWESRLYRAEPYSPAELQTAGRAYAERLEAGAELRRAQEAESSLADRMQFIRARRSQIQRKLESFELKRIYENPSPPADPVDKTAGMPRPSREAIEQQRWEQIAADRKAQHAQANAKLLRG